MARADDLIVFHQVVASGAFSKAAEQLNLTNSVVSKRISRLEKELGVQLLYRTTRKLTVTEAGQILYQGAKTVAQATQEAYDGLEGFGEKLTGHIRMSVPTISGELLLADAIAEFCTQHEGLSVDMSLSNRFVDLIAESYDLVIRTGHLSDSSLIARHIVDVHWIIFAAPTYLKRLGKPLSPEDLKNHNCLAYTYQETGANEWDFKNGEKHYTVSVKGNFSTDNAQALRIAALRGHGIAYVPRVLVYQDLREGTLVELLPKQVGKVLGLYAVYPFTRQSSKKIKALIEHIKVKYTTMHHYL